MSDTVFLKYLGEKDPLPVALPGGNVCEFSSDNKNICEVDCYEAELLMQDSPKSFIVVDEMPELDKSPEMEAQEEAESEEVSEHDVLPDPEEQQADSGSGKLVLSDGTDITNMPATKMREYANTRFGEDAINWPGNMSAVKIRAAIAEMDQPAPSTAE